MKCAVHTEVDASGFCRQCGKALCGECKRDVRGILYCEGCLASLVTRPQAAEGGGGNSPVLAGFLGAFPGLGAIYNGEYTKGMVHVAVFAGFVTILSGGFAEGLEAIFGIGLAFFILFMIVDSVRSAKALQRAPQAAGATDQTPGGPLVGPMILIGIGVLFMLQNFELLSVHRLMRRGWPLILIAVGVHLLWQRMQGSSSGDGK